MRLGPVPRLAALGLLSALVFFVPSGMTGAVAEGESALTVYSLPFGGQSLTVIGLELDAPTPLVRLLVPEGYALDLAEPVGTVLGEASAHLSEAAGKSGGAFVNAELVVDDPAAYTNDTSAQACAPGVHSAVWRAELNVLGQSFLLPIFIDAGSNGAGTAATVLSFCPTWKPPGVPSGLAADFLNIYIDRALSPPRVSGLYTWSGLLSPAVPGSLESDPARVFELRSLVAHPHVMTLRARHDAIAKTVVLSGKLTAAGLPEAGVKVRFSAYLESSDDFASFGPVTTNVAGEFAVRRRLETTTRFSASVEAVRRLCSAGSTAPGGCLAETVSPPSGVSVIVRARSPRDPRLEPRTRDQALALRINLKLGDFPPGWKAFAVPNAVFPCRGFQPNLSKLTVRGEAESPVFIEEKELGAAWSSASIYDTDQQALTAFDRQARSAAAQCVANEAIQEGTIVSSVEPIPFPRLGNQTRAFRIVVSDPEASGYLDLVWIRQGRAVIHMGFVALEELAIERGLAAKLAARARAR